MNILYLKIEESCLVTRRAPKVSFREGLLISRERSTEVNYEEYK